MREHAPITIQRILTLRQYPGFADAELVDLATIAQNVVEHTFAAGAVVAAPYRRVGAIHLVLDGRLAAVGTRHEWGPRQVFGALEAIAGRAPEDRVVAATATRTLQLSTAAFAEILEDNYSVLASVRRTLARRLLALDTALVARPRTLVEPTPGPLGMVDRLLVLRAHLPFARNHLQALSTLAQGSEEVHFAARTRILRAGDDADGCYVILDGVARVRRVDGPDVINAGAALGALETLAELPSVSDVDAVTSVRALRVPSAALFDVMEDHTDFAIGITSKLAGEVLDLAQMPPEVN
jgi:CRP-like cAMP-binding protein